LKKNNIKKIFQFINFLLLRIFGFFISFLPSRVIHYLGAFAGIIFYYCHASFRKKTLTNLSIAYGESRSEQEKKALAKKSFQNLSITCLEFFRMKSSKKKLSKIVTLEGSEEVLQLMKRGQGIIFLTGHQANWEIPFLAMTQYFPGIAIGKPIKNSWLNQWILSIREMNGGKIVLPKNAIRQCMKALKTGKFIGIVGENEPGLPLLLRSFPIAPTPLSSL
jgi:KDO2-lipid IV(A) lauroyltransferase